ncbi:MAG: PolC-type DNA polymerase III [Oscillospiraceae bacterium]|jgi:DNA polymerase-3 subunit alpha (Gram-positive type)|nr:PolC-type DNA polymerase III [Oscillospiraceae bacterium]
MNKLSLYFPDIRSCAEAVIVEAKYYQYERKLDLTADSNVLISAADLLAAEKFIANSLEINKVNLYPEYAEAMYTPAYDEELSELIKAKGIPPDMAGKAHRQLLKKLFGIVDNTTPSPPPDNGGNNGGYNAYNNGDKPRRHRKVKLLSKEKINGEIVPLKEMNTSGQVGVIKGGIISVNRRDIDKKKDGTPFNKTILTADIFDGTSALTVKLFIDTEDADDFDFLKKGNFIIADGKANYDDFAGELLFEPSAIAECEKEFKSREDNAPDKRVELHLHTNMSAMDAVNSAAEYVKQAYAWGHAGVAFTDHGNLQCYPEAMNAFEDIKYKNPDTPFKVIYGVEGYLVDDSEDTYDISKAKRYHICILVKNQTGLKNLYKLVSYSNLDYYYKHPLIPRSVLDSHRDGLILGSACEQGELFTAVYEDEPTELQERIAKYYDYLEVQPLGNNAFMLRNTDDNSGAKFAKSNDDLIALNRKIIALGEKLNIPVCATGDVHFKEPSDAVFREILQIGMKYSDAAEQPPIYYRTTDEMLAEFNYLDEPKRTEIVITNPRKIADSIEVFRPIPKGTYTPSLPGAVEDLQRIIAETTGKQYSKDGTFDNAPELVKARVQKEVDAIIKYGFAVLYMIAQKLVAKSNEMGYLVGSRGSVGSSVAAYFLGISEVNALPPHYRCPKCAYSDFIDKEQTKIQSGFDLPPKNCPDCGHPLIGDGQDIPFETFLGFKGDKAPDIDLNFSGDVQSAIHRYTEELFGKDKVFKAGTISAIQEKTVFPWVKEYGENHGINLNNAEIARLSAGCAGIKRTTGQHPGGMVVVPAEYEVYDFTPVQHPADKKDSDNITTHFDFHALHDTILKLDELGHDVPTLYKYLQDHTGMNISDVPPADEKVLSLFAGTSALGIENDPLIEYGTFGIPEFGTPFVMKMLKGAKPKTFADLLQISGLSHGTDVWLGNAEELIKNGTCTISDVIGTRDDIMVYLIDKGMEPSLAFKIMEFTRKGKAKKEFNEDIYNAFKGNNIPDWYVKSCLKIKYMFPKAHAAAYVTGAVKLGWFKVYKPVYFYAAILLKHTGTFDIRTVAANDKTEITNRISELDAIKKPTAKDAAEKDALVLVYEMLSRGIKFLPPRYNKSDPVEYVVDEDENGIRLPYTAIAGCGAKAAQTLYEVVKSGDYNAADELSVKAGINDTLREVMDVMGFFEGLQMSAQISLWDM